MYVIRMDSVQVLLNTRGKSGQGYEELRQFNIFLLNFYTSRVGKVPFHCCLKTDLHRHEAQDRQSPLTRKD